jgi:hypothetical protein
MCLKTYIVVTNASRPRACKHFEKRNRPRENPRCAGVRAGANEENRGGLLLRSLLLLCAHQLRLVVFLEELGPLFIGCKLFIWR